VASVEGELRVTRADKPGGTGNEKLYVGKAES
jgi:hypothetical protein